MTGGEYTGLKIREEFPAGTKFGARTVICETSPRNSVRRFSVRCECGNVNTVPLPRLKQMLKGKVGSRCRKCAYKKR